MVKSLIRMGLTRGMSMFLTPHVNRLFDRAAARAPSGSFLEEMLLELSNNYSTALIKSLGETIGDLAFGEKK